MPVRHEPSSPAPPVDPPPTGWRSITPHSTHALIVGAGPNGRPYHSRPPDAYLIALNSAITLPWRFDLWMVFDVGALNYAWFKTKTSATRLFGSSLAHKAPADYTFDHMPCISQADALDPAILHGGATIAGCAIQFAHHVGCTHITLLGIDQWGDLHFDGLSGAPKHFGRIWSTVKHLQKVIHIVSGCGTRVDSLSSTKLVVPRVKLW